MNAQCPTGERRVFYRYEEIDEALGANEIEILTTDRDLEDTAAAGSKPEDVKVKKGFWRRQFGSNVTRKQRFFDWAFGVVMPVICFAADPFIFKNDTRPLLGRQVVFAYILSFAAILTTVAWLLWGDRLKGAAAAAAGVMTAGSLAALVIAVILLPFSFLGLALVIGALGFTPFFTSVIWARNAVRAYRSAQDHVEEPVLCHTVGLIALLSMVIPIVANSEIGRDTLIELAGLIK